MTFTAGPDVAGVATTAVTLGAWADYYAQDSAGNVWWFGREGEWRAGEDGAEAGIAMLAKPRVGDGYAEMATDGEAGRRSVIKDLEGQGWSSRPRREAGVVVLRRSTSAAPGWC